MELNKVVNKKMTTENKLRQAEQYREHYPVLLSEVLEGLLVKDGCEYLDCTFGAGGYSRAILKAANCRLTAIDQDDSVKNYADQLDKEFGERFDFINCNFAESAVRLSGRKFDGIVLDLGVSSMQLDQRERGFSFQEDGPLDMRMSGEGKSAADFINSADEGEIADVIYRYGDEQESRRIAKAIILARSEGRISSTLQLARIVREAKRMKKSKIDLATKTFQAIRIHVNCELEVLESFLLQVNRLLKVGGRLVVVSFHSLEDSIVKLFIKKHALRKIARSKYADKFSKLEAEKQEGKWLKPITVKPIVPSNEELEQNIRSRSAKMRVVERFA